MIFPTWFFFDRVGPLFKLQYRNQSQKEWIEIPSPGGENFRWTHYFYNPRITMWLYINSLTERIGITALNDPTEVQSGLQKKLKDLVQNWLSADTSNRLELQISIQNPTTDSKSDVVWNSLG